MRNLQAHHDSIHAIHHAPKLLALQELLKESGIGTDSLSADKPTLSGSGPSGNNSVSLKTSAQLSELQSGVTSQHRALIFCQLKDMLDIVENDLLKSTCPRSLICGWMAVRMPESVMKLSRNSTVTRPLMFCF